MVIGVTGGIGSGKSTVLNYIKNNYNVKILFTDNIAKQLMEPSNICYNLIINYFGTDILVDNKIDSNLLGKIVFNDEEKLIKLNSFTHPYVIEYVEKFISENSSDIIFIESALLMNTKLKDLCEYILYVDTDLELRKERLKIGRNYTDEKIEQVLKNQKAIDTQNMYIINNNSYQIMIQNIKKFMSEVID